MATECAQIVTLADKQKSSGKSIPPTKVICQPFTLRLILGVPILKEGTKPIGELEGLFAKFAHNDAGGSSQSDSDHDVFWDHVVIGVNSIVKQMEEAARDSTSSKPVDPFLVILLDFAWLNSQLGHHLAHLCSGTPHTSLVAVSPPGKLAKLVSAPLQSINSSSPKVACVGIRSLMMPNAGCRLAGLRDFMRSCASLTGKPLPLDPSAATSAAAMTSSGGLTDVDGQTVPGLGVTATPQYVPILPKPPTSVLIPSQTGSGSLGMVDMASPTALMQTSAIPGGYMVTPGRSGTPSLISSSVGDMGSMMITPGQKMLSNRGMMSHTPLQKPQIPPKPPVPRPAVRHIPADDWLTYKLDHAKLYKCSADVSKELENHSLYIHDVADIWALYPRQFQKSDIVMRRSAPTPKSTSSAAAAGSASSSHHHHKGGPRGVHPPAKQRRVAASGLPPPPHHDYFDDDDVEDDEDDDYEYGPAVASSSAAYLESPTRHHYSRHSSSGGAGLSRGSERGMYRKSQAPEQLPSSSSYGGLGKSRRRRTSPRW